MTDLEETNGFTYIQPGKLAGMRLPQDPEWIKKLEKDHNVGLVVSVLEEPLGPALFEGTNVENVLLYCEDSKVPSEADLRVVAERTRQVNDSGKAVVYHCKGGRGRTGSALAAFLILSKGYSAKAAIEEVRATRPGTIEAAQEAALYNLAASLSQ